MISCAILIPARYGSTRFPGKPLALLDGVPMIKRVFDACQTFSAPCCDIQYDTFVLTDHNEIADLFPPKNVILSSNDYENGTERCAGALSDNRLDKYKRFINVQGDMPDVDNNMVNQAWHTLNDYDVSTIYTKIDDELKDDPNSVKMVTGELDALWFGRGFKYGYHHLGVYGYRREVLEKYPSLVVSEEEKIEKLEQLRWLKNGYRIGAKWVKFNGVEINTPSDLEEWNESR